MNFIKFISFSKWTITIAKDKYVYWLNTGGNTNNYRDTKEFNLDSEIIHYLAYESCKSSDILQNVR